MEISSLTHRTHQMHSDGYRTPVIEDEHHPLNLWRSQQSGVATIDTYFPPQDQTTREQLDRFRRLENGLEYMSKEICEQNTGHKIHLPWKERLKHTTWAYFTMTMATGGIANVLHAGMYSSPFTPKTLLCVFSGNTSDELTYAGSTLSLRVDLLRWPLLLLPQHSYVHHYLDHAAHPVSKPPNDLSVFPGPPYRVAIRSSICCVSRHYLHHYS